MGNPFYYVRRCKNKTGVETHERMHAADANAENTLCGKELNEMWFIESSWGKTADDITCPKCRRAI